MLPAKKAPLSIVSEGWKRLGTPNQRLLQKRIQSEWKYLGQSQWYVKERNRWKSQELQGSCYLCFSILCRDSTEELVWWHQFRLFNARIPPICIAAATLLYHHHPQPTENTPYPTPTPFQHPIVLHNRQSCIISTHPPSSTIINIISHRKLGKIAICLDTIIIKGLHTPRAASNQSPFIVAVCCGNITAYSSLTYKQQHCISYHNA